MIRDNKYLENLLYDIWENNFCDVARLNFVTIKYGKHSKRQLGSIKWHKDPKIFEKYIEKYKLERALFEHPSVSVITLTRYFSYDFVPEFVIKATIVHELCHYTHGFNSPLTQRYAHPHRGGVIKKEFIERDLLELYLESKKWISENWIRVIS